ncbi:IS1249 family transposase [Dialister invisus]|uniref:IS1249 family transposase n=1 Tax=Dialister invisus TaxID=218538 RepID=UPI00352205D9
MNQVRCFNCGNICVKNGKTKAGTQRWLCKECSDSFTNPIDNSTKQFVQFQHWLFSKAVQKEMSGAGKSFRRKISKFWEIWPMPPKIESPMNVVYVDGIYLGRKACILICCNERYVLGWYLCRYENSRAWEALMQRIAAPAMVVSDGGHGFRKALKRVWPKAKLQRCTFHASLQVKRYTTDRPKTIAGIEMYMIAKDLLMIKDLGQAANWVTRLINWRIRHKAFLSEMTRDEKGKLRPMHERLLKAERSLARLVRQNTLFTYLDESLSYGEELPSTNNRIEGGINAQLRTMLRNHRGMSIERRIKAVFWWCYFHTPKPLSASEILKVMPTDRSISKLYKAMNERSQLEDSIPTWGDAIVWHELHKSNSYPIYLWD